MGPMFTMMKIMTIWKKAFYKITTGSGIGVYCFTIPGSNTQQNFVIKFVRHGGSVTTKLII
jgi:hypothetical protein